MLALEEGDRGLAISQRSHRRGVERIPFSRGMLEEQKAIGGRAGEDPFLDPTGESHSLAGRLQDLKGRVQIDEVEPRIIRKPSS